MIMKITAGKREDIIRQRDEWDAENQRREARRKEQGKRFHAAQEAVKEPVRQLIMSQLSQFDALKIEVNVEREWMFDDDEEGRLLRVRIGCNQNSLFGESVALAWHFDVRLNQKLEVVKETGSWSGLKAITEEQLNSLSQSVEALRLLNNMDWAALLHQPGLPNYKDYYQTPEGEQPLGNRPNFKQQLIEASIEECIGKDILIAGYAPESSGFRTGSELYFLIHKETPSQYVVSEQLKSWVDQWLANGEKTFEQVIEEIKRYTYRVRKSTLFTCIRSDNEGNITTLSN